MLLLLIIAGGYPLPFLPTDELLNLSPSHSQDALTDRETAMLTYVNDEWTNKFENALKQIVGKHFPNLKKQQVTARVMQILKHTENAEDGAQPHKDLPPALAQFA